VKDMIVTKHCKFIDSLLENMDVANVLLLYGFNSVHTVILTVLAFLLCFNLCKLYLVSCLFSCPTILSCVVFFVVCVLAV